MIIIYGHRAYGRVDEWGGEYAQTSFAHVYYVPLVPTGSRWVTRELNGQQLGLPIGLHAKSIAAAYLRTWALVVAAAMFGFAPGIVTGIVAVALCAASAYSWSWRGLRGVRARQRSDFNLLAYGTRCEPALIMRDVRVKLVEELEGRRTRLPEQRPVEDIARFGANDLQEAVIAYGLLRLAALEQHDPDAEAGADRLLVGSHETVPSGEGPYRQTRPEAPDAAATHAQLSQVASIHSARVHGASRAAGTDSLWARPGMKAIIVAALAVVAAALIGLNREALFGCDDATLAQLETNAPIYKYVAVTCDSFDEGGEIVDPRTNAASEHVFLCHLGSRVLVVTAEPSVNSLPQRIEGRVRKPSHSKWTWPEDLRTDPATLQLYLDTKGHANDLAWAIAGIVVGLAALGLGAFWLLRFVRARRAPA